MKAKAPEMVFGAFPRQGAAWGSSLPWKQKHTPASLFFPNQLEPLGRKTDTLDLTADVALSCPTQVIRQDLLSFSPGTRRSDLTLPPAASPTVSSLPISPLIWKQMDFGGWKEVDENRKGRSRWEQRSGPKQRLRIRMRKVDS